MPDPQETTKADSAKLKTRINALFMKLAELLDPLEPHERVLLLTTTLASLTCCGLCDAHRMIALSELAAMMNDHAVSIDKLEFGDTPAMCRADSSRDADQPVH